jgi:hypothetical protein
MHDTKERLSLFWIFALLNYLYADVLALWEIVGSLKLTDAPHLPPWALASSAVLMEIPMAMIVACRLLPFRANRMEHQQRIRIVANRLYDEARIARTALRRPLHPMPNAAADSAFVLNNKIGVVCF